MKRDTPGNFIDMTGQSYGLLTVLGRAPTRYTSGGQSKTQWTCRCECGNEIETAGQRLRRGETKSCGCARSTTEARAKNAAYRRLAWQSDDYRRKVTNGHAAADTQYRKRAGEALAERARRMSGLPASTTSKQMALIAHARYQRGVKGARVQARYYFRKVYGIDPSLDFIEADALRRAIKSMLRQLTTKETNS